MKNRSTQQRFKALWIKGLLIASVLVIPWLVFQFGRLVAFGGVILVAVGLALADGLHLRLIAAVRRAARPANVKTLEQVERAQLESDGWVRVQWFALEQALIQMKHDQTPMAPYIRHFDYIVYLSLDFIQDVAQRNEMLQRFKQVQNGELSPGELMPLLQRIRAIADGKIAPNAPTSLTDHPS